MTGWFGSFTIPTMLASPADLQDWTDEDPPANAVPILRACTAIVLDAVQGSYYDVDPETGYATDLILAKTMTEATCIQAAAWIELGINPLAGGIDLGGVKSSKKIGTASFTIAGAESTAAAKAYAAKYLVDDAVTKLRQQNLIGNGPYAL